MSLCPRLLVTASSSFRLVLSSTQNNNRYSINAKKNSVRQCCTPVPNNNTKCLGSTYSTNVIRIAIPIVPYKEIKDLPNHPEKWLIDVREPIELRKTGVIPTAINIPLGEMNAAFSMKSSQFQAKYNRNKPKICDEVIFHCKTGRRSKIAVLVAFKFGYTNAKNYLGSWFEWAEIEGLPK